MLAPLLEISKFAHLTAADQAAPEKKLIAMQQIRVCWVNGRMGSVTYLPSGSALHVRGTLDRVVGPESRIHSMTRCAP
jgi:hypothetical protein